MKISYNNNRQQRFLIIGNGRTGSTWLLTSLDQLPGVNAQHELKWKDPTGDFRADAHILVNKNSSMLRAIERVTHRESRVRGTKLIFNPYHYMGPVAFENLEKTIEPGIRLILIKRNYLETWLSWKARGVYHEVNDIGPLSVRANPMIEAMKAMEKPPLRRLILHHNGQALSDGDGTAYPLQIAVDDMFQLLANDVQTLALIRKRNGIIVDYAKVTMELGRIANFIGAPASTTVREQIVAKPQTRKLEALEHCLRPIDTLRSIAEAMDQAFNTSPSAGYFFNPELLWKWKSEDTGTVGTPQILQALEKVGFPPQNFQINWKIQRPVISD